ncbi:MAG: SGNH/GDSL hydrolase family protein [Terrimicrobiaceae bacterium]
MLAIVALQALIVFAPARAILAEEPPAASPTPGLVIPVDSKAFLFSPGNWTGDEGRAGKVFRQTWCPGAYFRVKWETPAKKEVSAKILLDTAGYGASLKPPLLAYCIDGVWRTNIPCTNEISISETTFCGQHELSVYLQSSEQKERWGSEGKSGLSVLRVIGVEVEAGSSPLAQTPSPKWALIVGDSITEGSGASELSGYAHLVGQALTTQGFEYGISACGWNGWIQRGDGREGDVPGYYVVRNSADGAGGEYDDAASRWNKIDGNNHSLLDSNKRISAYGQTGQEPSLVLINYGTNDKINGWPPSDVSASIVQGLAAIRNAAPQAQIIVLIPFGGFYDNELMAAVELHKKSHPEDKKIATINLGKEGVFASHSKDSPFGDLHPNDRGHANFAAKIIPQVIHILGVTTQL